MALTIVLVVGLSAGCGGEALSGDCERVWGISGTFDDADISSARQWGTELQREYDDASVVVWSASERREAFRDAGLPEEAVTGLLGAIEAEFETESDASNFMSDAMDVSNDRLQLSRKVAEQNC